MTLPELFCEPETHRILPWVLFEAKSVRIFRDSSVLLARSFREVARMSGGEPQMLRVLFWTKSGSYVVETPSPLNFIAVQEHRCDAGFYGKGASAPASKGVPLIVCRSGWHELKKGCHFGLYICLCLSSVAAAV